MANALNGKALDWVVDVNVLVNAYITQTPAQLLCKAWLGATLQNPSMTVWLPTATELGFVRLLGSGGVPSSRSRLRCYTTTWTRSPGLA